MNFNDKVRALALRLIGNNNAVLAATEPKVYIALLSQTGTDAPVATVLKNTLGGSVVWSRDDIGVYYATLNDAFTVNKTFVIIGIEVAAANVDIISYDINFINIATTLFNPAGPSFDASDGILISTPIEIRVYP